MKTRAWLLLSAFGAVSLIWGSTYFAIRLALDGFPPFLLGATRFVVAGGLLLVLARLRGEALPRSVEWRSAAVTGSLFFVVGNGFVNVAEQSVASGLASVLVATMPLWAALISRFAGERASRRELLGLAFGLAGVGVMNLGGELRASPTGTVAALLAPIGWALGSVVSKRSPLPAGMAMRTASQMLAGGAGMLVVGVLSGERVSQMPSGAAVWALVYLIVFGSLVGFSAYAFLLANVRATLATSYAYVNPVVALAIGVTLGGERLDLPSALGAVVVIGSVVLAVRPQGTALRRSPRLELVAAARSLPPSSPARVS